MIRVLDPTTAIVRPGAATPQPTAYIGEELLVVAEALTADLADQMAGVLATLGWTAKSDRLASGRTDKDPRSASPFATVRLVRRTDALAPEPDAWVALQHLLTEVPALERVVRLNHVLVAGGSGGYWGGIGSGGYWGGIGSGGYWGGIGSGGYWGGIAGTPAAPAEFDIPGSGGRSPVAVVLTDPARTAPRLRRPPVVVMPDTGIGSHPWFTATEPPPPVPPRLWPRTSRVRIEGGPGADAGSGISDPLLGGLDRLAGHGTFIAGIVRQTCPAATLEAHPIMSSAGVMPEDDLLAVLHDLLQRQRDALAGGRADRVVDVLSLSVGYYDETIDPAITGHDLAKAVAELPVTDVLRELGRAGVLVVAGAGNDATSTPFLPASLAVPEAQDAAALPLVSVGSLNPDGTVSLFSNAGMWVTTNRPGAAIVSTLPVTENASAQPSTLTPGTPAARATIDRDDFSGGFGVWSGTSFATPVIAGELAQALVELGCEEVTVEAMIERGRRAIGMVLSTRGRS